MSQRPVANEGVKARANVNPRRRAREWIVQLLFRLDLNPGRTEQALEDWWSENPADGATRTFVETSVRQVCAHRDLIDSLIRRCADNWEMHRMAVTDRNVLRLAVQEMLLHADVPPAVTINEAVDLAKAFNSADSGRFVNGILDRVRKEIGRPPRSQGQLPDLLALAKT